MPNKLLCRAEYEQWLVNGDDLLALRLGAMLDLVAADCSSFVDDIVAVMPTSAVRLVVDEMMGRIEAWDEHGHHGACPDLEWYRHCIRVDSDEQQAREEAANASMTVAERNRGKVWLLTKPSI